MFTHGFTKAAFTASRVTPTTRPGNPLMGGNKGGLKSITGASAIEPFGRPLHQFGTKSQPRSIQTFNRLKRGI
jgi:hypothetical protein